jgi:outer membrane protein TolC
VNRFRPASWATTVLLAGISLPAGAQAPRAARALSLDEALNLAAPASEAVALTRVAGDRARGDVLRARSELFPQITGSVSYARQLRSQYDNLFGEAAPDTSSAPPPPTSCDPFSPDPTRPVNERLDALERAVECTTTVNPFAGFGRLPFGRKNNYSIGLSGSQVLFDGGRIFGQVRAAQANRAAAAIAVTAAEAQLVLDVVRAYYDAALGDRLVTIAEATLAQADTTLRQTQLRREVGTAPEFDVLRARVARDNQRPLVIQARTQRDLAYVHLKQQLNLPLQEGLALTTTLGDTTLAGGPRLARLAAAGPDTAAANRSAVRQAAEAIRAQEGLDAAARAQRLPSVVLSSQWSRLAYPSRGLPGWNEFLTDWRLTVGVQVPIFTGGRIRGDRVAARANLEEARLRHQQVTEAAQLDARDALAQLEGAVAAWEASEGTAAQATRAYEIADLRFREGVSTQTELLDARIALQQAEMNRAQAARDLQIARVRVALLADLPLGDAVAAPSRAIANRPASAQGTAGGTTLP